MPLLKKFVKLGKNFSDDTFYRLASLNSFIRAQHLSKSKNIYLFICYFRRVKDTVSNPLPIFKELSELVVYKFSSLNLQII